MVPAGGFVQRHAVRVVAITAVAAIYGFTRLPAPGDAAREDLADRFAFSRFELPRPPGPRRVVRDVHPRLERFSAWMSSVGAGVALADLDGDALANDVCYVDNGTDSLVVTPAPSTPARYATFTLDPAPLRYDRKTMAPMGCLPGDLNEDGRTDLLAYYWGRPPIAFLQRTSAASGPAPLAARLFRPVEVVPTFERWYTNAATRADFDGDGRLDLVLGNYFQDGAEILDARSTSSQEMQRSMSRADNAGHNRLLLGMGGTAGAEPTVQFREAAGALPGRAEVGWTLALGAADLDGDLLPELYVANDFGPDVLLHNRSGPGAVHFVPLYGHKGLTTPNSKVVGHDSFKGMGIDFADLNGDGWLDIYVSNIAAQFALEESHFVWLSTGEVERMREGYAPYVDASETLGLSRSNWGWDCRFVDFDNDGVAEAIQATGFVRGNTNRWPELHEIAMGNDNMLHHPCAWPRLHPGDDLSGRAHNPFFVRGPSGRYFDRAAEVGMDLPSVSRGLAVADVDGDGDLDFAVANQWQDSYLFRNDGRRSGRSLLLDLRLPVGAVTSAPAGPSAATAAIGATATVTLPDGRRLVGQVDGGSGHSGKRSPELHFGLGSALAADAELRVEIAYRDRAGGVHREVRRMRPGRHLLVLGSAATAGEG
jgi:enediyne biosynthesis protein E4